jgi:hypothetical protein
MQIEPASPRLRAFHGEPALKIDRIDGHKIVNVSPMSENRNDAMVLAVIDKGFLIVDPDTGTVSGTRWAQRAERGVKNVKGYIVFTLHYEGRRAQIKAHRAVWLSVNRVIPTGMMIDHINRDKSDNRIINLRLADAKLNSANRRSYAGEGSPSARITREIAEKIRELHRYRMSYAYVARAFDVSKSLVAQIVRRELWT